MTAVGGIVGVAGIAVGLWWADAVAALFISGSILHDGVRNVRTAVGALMDSEARTVDGSRPHPLQGEVDATLAAQPWVADARWTGRCRTSCSSSSPSCPRSCSPASGSARRTAPPDHTPLPGRAPDPEPTSQPSPEDRAQEVARTKPPRTVARNTRFLACSQATSGTARRGPQGHRASGGTMTVPHSLTSGVTTPTAGPGLTEAPTDVATLAPTDRTHAHRRSHRHARRRSDDDHAHPGRPRPLDRALGSRGHHRLGERRPDDRPPQPRSRRSSPSSSASPCGRRGASSSRSSRRSASTLTVDQQFWLIAVPSLVGASLRIPYTFAVPLFGGRNWTIVSALLLLLPASALAFVVSNPDTSFGVLLVVAALAGLGGGNFASSMANISFFYPEREKGKALGLNAAGGNLGTAAVQFAVPLVIVSAAGLQLERAGLMFIPLILVAAAPRRAVDAQPVRRRRPTTGRSARRCTTGTPGSSPSSTSAPSARSSATPVRSRRC